MKANTRVLGLGAAALCTILAMLCSPAMAAVPASIAIEGALQTKGGGPVSDGEYTITFRVYKDKSDLKASWEDTAKVTVSKGAFAYVLGSGKSLSPLLAVTTGTLHVSAQVQGDPELPRVALHAAPYALPAARAESIDCTGCVSTSAIKAGSLNHTGGSLTADKVVAKTLEGDGSKITGIKIPSGKCPSGQVVTGIDGDGKLLCGSASPLPDDGVDQVSQGLIAIVGDLYNGNAPVNINDNNPKGTESVITLGNVGKVDKLTVTVSAQIDSGNSGIDKLRVCLIAPGGAIPANAGFDPNYCSGKFQYLLHDKTGAGKTLLNTWPSPTKTVKGDINEWIGKDPSGKWTLQVVDVNFDTNGVIGKLTKFQISARTTGNNKVNVVKDLVVDGATTFNKSVTINGNLDVTGTVTANAAAKLMFPEGSRPFLWGWYGDRHNSNNIYGWWQDVAYNWKVKTMDDVHRITQSIVWGDDRGNYFFQEGGVNYGNGNNDRSSGILIAFIKNTTTSNITHNVCFWYSSRGCCDAHGGIAINQGNVWNQGGNARGQTCVNVTFPANKTSVLLQKSGAYHYTHWHGQYGRHLNGYYNDTWSKSKMPKGLVWDYDMYYKWVTGQQHTIF